MVRGSPLRVEPDVAFLGFPELSAISLGNQRAGQRVGLLAENPADEFGTRGDVAPLVGSSHLEGTPLVLVEIEKVVALKKLIGKLSEGHSLAGFARKPFLHGILGHHIVHRDVLSDVAGEGKETVVLHPVVVVDQFRPVRSIGVKIEEAGKLPPDALHIVRKGLFIEKVPLLRLHRRVPNHSGSTANEGERLVAAILEMLEYHHTYEVTYVK